MILQAAQSAFDIIFKPKHKTKKMSKHAQIREHINKWKSITGLQALTLFGVYRLSSVINRLRKEGINIKTEYAGKENYARYRKIKI